MIGSARTVGLPALVALALLMGCAPQGSQGPAFYDDLASSRARFDAEAAQGMINAYRIKEGLAPLPLNAQLGAVAKAEATAVSVRALGSGKVAPSDNLPERVREAGYPLGAMRQNVSAGYYTTAEAFSGWRDSPQHRDTMLMENATDMGIAAIYQPRAKYRVYWTLIVANRSN